LAEAYQQFREFLLQEPDNEDVSLSHALMGIELERYSRSRRTLLSLLKLHPENDQLRIYLGQLELWRSRSEEAIYWFSEVRDDALFFDAQIQMATAVANLEGSEAALDFLSELIPLTTNEQVSLYLTREGFLRDLGDLEIVLELLDAAIQDIPDNGKLLYSRAILFAELDQIAQHEADMRRVIELDPENAHAFNALGYTLADQTTRYDEALELILRALELSPNDPFILDSMGWIHFRLGQLNRAEKFLRQAHNVRTDAEIAAHLGEVLWQRGAKEEAELIWQSGVSLEPENKTLLETMERLRK
jgi:tetratricopeptide (TPR) repeat protein